MLGSNLSDDQVRVVSQAIQALNDEFQSNIPVEELQVGRFDGMDEFNLDLA